MGIGAQDHGAALRHLLSCIGVDDGLVGRHVDTAVLFRGREAEDMVILIDSAAHGTQAVVAVGKRIGDGKLLHAGGPGLLDNAHIGDVVGHHGVKADLQVLRIAGDVVGLENGPGHGPFPPLLRRDRAGSSGDAARQEHAVVMKCYHIKRPPVCHGGAVFLPPNIPYRRPDEKSFCRKKPRFLQIRRSRQENAPGRSGAGTFCRAHGLNGALLAFQRNFGYPVGEVRRDA